MGMFWQKLKMTVYQEKMRFHKKGLKNVLAAIFLLLLIIFASGQIGRHLWPEHIQNKIFFTIGISFIIHFGCEILFFLLYLPGYLKLVPYYENYRISPEISKPWENANWQILRNRTIKQLLINEVLIYIPIFSLGMFSGMKFRFHDFPSNFQIGTQILLMYLMEDFFSYSIHRCFHQFQFLYKYHKVHHQYKSNWSMVAEYTHPIDYILSNIGPTSIVFTLMGSRCHCFMFFFWHVYKLLASKQAHSGYEFPWSPTRIMFFVAGSSYHDFHHSKNFGNFAGSVYIYDTFFSKQPTNKLYFEKYLKSQ